MAALIRAAALCVLYWIAAPVAAQCEFANNEITNPLAAGCGDVQLRYTESETGSGLVPLGYPVPAPVSSLSPVDGFRTYDSLHAAQQDLMLVHPEVHGEVVGRTHAGRDIWAYRIGTPGELTVYGRPKGAVMAVAGVHAREWQPPEAVAEIFERAVAALDDGGIGRYLADNLSVILVPVLNIDGFLQTQAFHDRTTADVGQPRDGRMRRKNLHHTDHGGVVDADLATVPDNFLGIDLNRNHPIGFQAVPNNTNPRSLVHAGPTVQSEAESQALLAAASLAPADRLRLYLDIHSFTQIYFTPQTGNADRDALTETVAARMRAVTGNKYRYSPDPPGAAIGTSADYFAHTFQVPSWTLETEPLNGGQDYGGTGVSHSGFVTPDREIARLRDEIARTALLGFYHQAGPPAVIAVEIRDGAGTIVWSARGEAAGAGTGALVESPDAALQAGGAYTLWLAFDKPMRWRDGGEVVQYAGQGIALLPSVTLEVADGSRNRAIELPVDAGTWLSEPGGAPAGFMNYRDDAFAVTFTLPADLPATATPAVLVVDTVDMAGQRVDADPATAVDWQSGRWQGYEDVAGEPSLTGGPDCTWRLWVGAAQAANSLECNARLDATSPVPEPPPKRGGGGIGFTWLLVMMALSIARPGNGRHPLAARGGPFAGRNRSIAE